MRVDHRGTDITMAEELLDGPDVVVVLEQVMASRTRSRSRGGRAAGGLASRTIHGAQVVAP